MGPMESHGMMGSMGISNIISSLPLPARWEMANGHSESTRVIQWWVDSSNVHGVWPCMPRYYIWFAFALSLLTYMIIFRPTAHFMLLWYKQYEQYGKNISLWPGRQSVTDVERHRLQLQQQLSSRLQWCINLTSVSRSDVLWQLNKGGNIDVGCSGRRCWQRTLLPCLSSSRVLIQGRCSQTLPDTKAVRTIIAIININSNNVVVVRCAECSQSSPFEQRRLTLAVKVSWLWSMTC